MCFMPIYNHFAYCSIMTISDRTGKKKKKNTTQITFSQLSLEVVEAEVTGVFCTVIYHG